MDIPRGTFSSIRRDTLLSAILAEVREMSFSGHVTASCRGYPVSLVFSEGNCVLAEYRGLQGHAAWQEIQALGGEVVEAGTYILTPQQIRLASEFNKNAAISAVSRPLQSGGKERNRDAAAREPVAKKTAAAGPLRLPRGTFCEIRRDLSANEVIDNLQGGGFSGYGLFSEVSGTFTLVFSGGVCVLADCRGERGSAALRLAKTVERLSEVSLYALSGQQVSLALEFNEGYGTVPAGASPATGAAGAGAGVGHRKNVATGSERRPPSGSPAPLSATVRDRGARRADESDPAPLSDLALLNMEGLDSIDPVAMAADLKSSYVSILDRLQLGHLVDTKEEKECE